MMNLPREPFFVAPYKEESGGVDFLGLRQVNLALIDQFLPGINNVTYSLRPYSVMCWIAWGFRRAAQQAGLKEVTRSQFDQFREKVEILFNWGHQLNRNGSGMVGNAQVAPSNGNVELSLKFADWKRNVSWFDAVNYGPSAKSDSGLGFLTQPLPGIYVPTESGEKLALALDGLLSQREHYSILTRLDATKASATVAQDLYEAWRIDNPSSREAEIYRQALYQENSIGVQSRLGHRSTSLKLILQTMRDHSEPLSTEQLRQLIANSPRKIMTGDDSEEFLSGMHAVWQVLQIRQAHRLAFEALFGWVEYRLMEYGRTHSAELVDDLIAAIQSNRPSTKIQTWLEDVLASIKIAQGDAKELFSVANKHQELNSFHYVTGILEDMRHSRDASAVRALEILLLCFVYAEEFLNANRTSSSAQQGGAARISLEYWAKFVASNRALPLSAFISKVIENFLLSQHFGVAAARYTEGKQRLRLTIEERGLVSMLNNTNEIWQPFPAADRLDAMLSLMADAGFVTASIDNGERLYSVER